MTQLTLFGDDAFNDDRPLPEIIAEHWGFPLQSHDIDGNRYYSVQDWLVGFGQSRNPRSLWCHMRTRHSHLEAVCIKLRYTTIYEGKKYLMHFAPADALILMSSYMDIKYSAPQVLTGGIPSKTSADSRRAGYVYLIRLNEIEGYYKIGITSRDIERRLAEIEHASPFTVSIVHTFPCADARRAERALHDRFRANHIKLEWFRLDQSDVESIQLIKDDSDIANRARTLIGGAA